MRISDWSSDVCSSDLNIKIALRRLRKFAREGAADELDIPGTIDGTARQGWLDNRMRPERRNAVQLLLFLDVGGSMDTFIQHFAEFFSATDNVIKKLQFISFHNCQLESGTSWYSGCRYV